MIKKEQITIEMDTKIAVELIEIGKNAIVDLEHVPFSKFTVKIIDLKKQVQSTEEVLKRLKETDEFKKRIEDTPPKVLNKILEDIADDLNNDMFIDVEITDNSLTVRPTYAYPYCITFSTKIIDCANSPGNYFESVKLIGVSEEKEEDFFKSESVVKAMITEMFQIFGCISYIQSESKEGISKNTRIDVANKKKNSKKKSSNKKTYIYKTNYNITNVLKPILETDRNYERKVESWFSRGHWRKLANGTRTWVKESIKKAKNIVNKDDATKEYKITRID